MTQPDPNAEIVVPTLKTYIVDTQSVNTKSYRVYAISEEDAKERFSDGLAIHSEATSPVVTSVTVEE
ncbi:hypothetical protein SEA_APIARY_74 [Rhodococcus phage Apiary]|nr:hypothetical protein SEA_BRAXOADDIE_74 [Rhodococcus phage Braxoaddie]WNM64997.1 hypothetical protein SEA_MASELOP_74 [Rhodococcus phage Maselop]WNM67458.1 hypothetical protein SEA_POLYYUKI_74 [Rhodococcus phage Polyyuki]WNM69882.1 hypothetical protein SEA_APIARY_74 [Rhodococcus phage Apiary]